MFLRSGKLVVCKTLGLKGAKRIIKMELSLWQELSRSLRVIQICWGVGKRETGKKEKRVLVKLNLENWKISSKIL